MAQTMSARTQEPPFPTKSQRIAGILVTVSEPPQPSGLTFLLPGAMLAESSYLSTRRSLHQQHQIVISFYVNVLFPKSHDAYAQDVAQIFRAYCAEEKNPTFATYNIVGHSVGGKIALLCVTNGAELGTVLALDPVDDCPPVFTKDDPTQNRSLEDHNAHVQHLVITHATATPSWTIPAAHNAAAIVQRNPSVHLQVHENAAHMCYTDDNGGILGWMMRGGTPQGNLAAREDVHVMIRKYIVG